MHYRARTYDPVTARFRQLDPIGFDGGDLNLYAYVGSRPLASLDPWGLIDLAAQPIEIRFGNTTNYSGNIITHDMHQARRDALLHYIMQLEQSFNKWIRKEKNIPGTRWANLPDCPCELLKNADGCYQNPDTDTWHEPASIPLKKYHPLGDAELRSHTPNQHGAGQQCIYDSDGKLITGGFSAGTVDAVSPPSKAELAWEAFLNAVSPPGSGPHEMKTRLAGHYIHDVEPFDAASEIDQNMGQWLKNNKLPDDAVWHDGLRYGNNIKKYLEVREPNKGRDSNGNQCPPNVK